MKKIVAAVVAVAVVAGCGIGGMKYYQDKKLNEVRTGVVKDLQDSVDLSDYRDAEQKEVKDILASTEDEILKAKNKGENE